MLVHKHRPEIQNLGAIFARCCGISLHCGMDGTNQRRIPITSKSCQLMNLLLKTFTNEDK